MKRLRELLHVMPTEGDHIPSRLCWCLPWEDSKVRGVWLHRPNTLPA